MTIFYDFRYNQIFVYYCFFIEFNTIINIKEETMTSKSSQSTANYKLIQMFGYKGPGQKIQEEDIISRISFDSSGQYLALGDHAGRIIIFETQDTTSKKGDALEYYAEFQSHSRQFDPLRSQQVSQTINDLLWLRGQGKYQKLITTNEKNIKIWKLFEKSYKKVAKSGGKQHNIPKLQTVQNTLQASNQCTLPSKHMTAINSLSCSGNEQFLISNDDVQAYLWNMQKVQKPYVLADYAKGKNIQDVKENLTFNSIHPTSDSLFLLGTDKGSLRMCDLRISSSFNQTVSFASQKVVNKNFFTQMVSSYSSAQLIKKGKYIVARDYLTVKVWDVANTSKPLTTITLQENIKAKLCDLFQNDSIYDKFYLSCSQDGNQILTGNYNNSFHLLNTLSGQNNQYQLNYKKNTVCRNMNGIKTAMSKLDHIRKTTACSFHPKKKMVAVASLNCFFIYSV